METLQKFKLNPWETSEGREVWKTRSQYFTWLRGALRKIWSDYPVRKVWKKNSLRPVTREEKLNKVYHPSTKNVGQCVLCKQWMAGSKLECDHIESYGGCTSQEEAEGFLWYCAGLTSKYFQLLCKPCHKIKSHSERYGMSFEEAIIAKRVIEIVNNKQVNGFLEDRGIVPASNAAKRKIQVSEQLIQERDNVK